MTTNLIKEIISKQNIPSRVFDPNEIRYCNLTKNQYIFDFSSGYLSVYPNHLQENIRLNFIYSLVLNFIISNSLNNKFRILFDLNDECYCEKNELIPSLSLTKKINSKDVLIPNLDFLDGSLSLYLKQALNDIPFQDKINKSIFIGSATNGLKRIEYCLKMLNDKNNIALISNFAENNPEQLKEKYENIYKIQSPPFEIKEQLKYKILVNIDGNTSCWSRLYWQMLSNSIPVYINKQNEDFQFFDYIDISNGYYSCTDSDCLDLYSYILNESNTEEVNNKNINGKKLILNLFKEYIENPKQISINSFYEIFLSMIKSSLPLK